MMIDSVVWAQYVNVTDTQTDSHVATANVAPTHCVWWQNWSEQYCDVCMQLSVAASECGWWLCQTVKTWTGGDWWLCCQLTAVAGVSCVTTTGTTRLPDLSVSV